MKLGLLVVLAVVALVPALSEGRTISKCELREKLRDVITLPRGLQRFKEKILEIVICELNRRSHLNSGLVKVYGSRRMKTTARPTTTTTTLSALLDDAVTTRPVTNRTTSTERTTMEPTAAKRTTIEPTAAERTTMKPTAAERTTIEPTAAERTITKPTTTKPMTIESTLEPNQTSQAARGVRRKREAGTFSEESNSTEMERNLDELLNEEESKFNEEELKQDDNRMGDEDEAGDEEDGEKGGYEDEEDDEEDGEKGGHKGRQEAKEGGKRRKRSLRHWRLRKRVRRPWSLGFYGLFQLSDSHFCYSGYRWSRNICRTSCTAFTDDNIMDDIDCLMRTGYWRYLLRASSHWCFHAWNFLGDCR